MIVWHSLQEYAFERRAKYSKRAVKVFCAESHHEPYRKFLTGLLDQFVAYYYALTPILRHHYEVIPYDNTCRLYFDVEYKRALNTELDEEEIMTILKSGIICAVAQFLGAEINETNIVDLVATTDQKMSHHLIVHIPGCVFQNNLVCGDFVKLFHNEMRKFAHAESDSSIFNEGGITQLDAKKLFPNSAEGKHFVCDLAVYTRNRQFRLLDSSKHNKTNFLRVSPGNSFPLSENPEERMKQTLVCASSLGSEVLVSANLTCADNIPGPSNRRSPRLAPPATLSSATAATGTGALDDFVLQVVRQSNPTAALGRRHQYPDGQCIRYDVVGEQWCGRKGGAHKSNRVYFMVNNFRHSVYQKCYDPDCRNYEGNQVALPQHLQRNQHQPVVVDDDYFGDDEAFEAELASYLSDVEEV